MLGPVLGKTSSVSQGLPDARPPQLPLNDWGWHVEELGVLVLQRVPAKAQIPDVGKGDVFPPSIWSFGVTDP